MIYDLMTLLICSRFRLPNFSSYFRCNQSDLAFSLFHACCLEAQVAGEVNETREKATWKDFVIFRATPSLRAWSPSRLLLSVGGCHPTLSLSHASSQQIPRHATKLPTLLHFDS